MGMTTEIMQGLPWFGLRVQYLIRSVSTLEDSDFPLRCGWRKHGDVPRPNVLRSHAFAMVANLDVIFDIVEKLNGEPFGRIEHDLQIVRLGTIGGLNSKLLLFMNRIGQLVFGDAHEIRVEQVPAILA